jgi:hypothetical protein
VALGGAGTRLVGQEPDVAGLEQLAIQEGAEDLSQVVRETDIEVTGDVKSRDLDSVDTEAQTFHLVLL